MRQNRILLVTDAWHPQINGVVRTMEKMAEELKKMGQEIFFITPQDYRTIPCPTYPEIRLSINAYPKVYRKIREINPNVVHIATEGPLGFFARGYCIDHKIHFTTSYHTKFPEYIKQRFKIPLKITYAYLRFFHKRAAKILVTTPTMVKELSSRGFKNLVVWARGVDHSVFSNTPKKKLSYKSPIFIYVGRVAIEKNIKTFLNLKLEGSKIVIGDGPQLNELKKKYTEINFLGAMNEKEIAAYLAASDVFVFPSKTDTFGIVIIEALAAGVPVAAYPVPGPIDILQGTSVDCLDEDLSISIKKALKINREDCKKVSEKYTWENCAKIFLDSIIPNF
jgi:glycosyltransferase involved in cell wall biosynthesis